MDKKYKISYWLDEEIPYESYPSHYVLENKDISLYYKNNDAHLEMNDEEEIDKLLYNNDNDVNYIQLYKQGNSDYLHYINHFTPRYHANMLFNQMIDYCIKNNYVDNKKQPIIHKLMRSRFYEFCYNNSYPNYLKKNT
tara:strand:- start:531 stop:944 length:414 start_codon:yes stop_codon:yes gene_type:complete